jgi:excisionase family DNA binding protein
MTERLLTIPEVAGSLSLSPFTVWRMVLDGRLPSHKIGRSRRVSQSDINAMLDASRQEGGKAKGKGFPSKPAGAPAA